jgi:hypothetical protein
MIPEWPFDSPLLRINVTLENNFSIRWDMQIDCFTLNQVDRFPP